MYVACMLCYNNENDIIPLAGAIPGLAKPKNLYCIFYSSRKKEEEDEEKIHLLLPISLPCNAIV